MIASFTRISNFNIENSLKILLQFFEDKTEFLLMRHVSFSVTILPPSFHGP